LFEAIDKTEIDEEYKGYGEDRISHGHKEKSKFGDSKYESKYESKYGDHSNIIKHNFGNSSINDDKKDGSYVMNKSQSAIGGTKKSFQPVNNVNSDDFENRESENGVSDKKVVKSQFILNALQETKSH
jgi:hypothetical protein